MKRTSCLTFLLLSSTLVFAQSDSSIGNLEIKKTAIADSGKILRKLIVDDLNGDGFQDVAFLENDEYGTPVPELNNPIKYILGSSSGIDPDNSEIWMTNFIIGDFFREDWNGDGHQDIITQHSRSLGGNSAAMDMITIYLLNGINITDSLSFRMSKGFLMGLSDLDLDGLPDLVFSENSIGWNNRTGIPESKPLLETNDWINTLTLLDFDQDGYLDYIEDNFGQEKLILRKNLKNRTFEAQSVGLPKWYRTLEYDESSPFFVIEDIWLNDDEFPDLMIGQGYKSVYKQRYVLYEFDSTAHSYSPSQLQFYPEFEDNFPTDTLAADPDSEIPGQGNVFPIHFDNDGYIDFVEIPLFSVDPDEIQYLILWKNNQNESFSKSQLPFPLSDPMNNFFKKDIDNDGDLDVLFNTWNTDTLYQIVNKEIVTNSPPELPDIDSLIISENDVTVMWDNGSDTESLQGHVQYSVLIESAGSQRNGVTHSKKISFNDLSTGDYSIKIEASDPLLLSSGYSDAMNFTITFVSNEDQPLPQKEVTLHQNYPNPFNPSTLIRYQLPVSSVVSLKVFDMLGREVAVLVDGKENAGSHEVTFNAKGLSSGVYFYRLETNGFVDTKQFTLIK